MNLDHATLAMPAQKQTLSQFSFDGVVWALWKKGFDTAKISKIMGAKQHPESKVANRLAAMRDAERP